MKILKYIYLTWICARHGINPFRKNIDNKDKFCKRLTEKEKQWIINNSTIEIEYIKNLLYCDDLKGEI